MLYTHGDLLLSFLLDTRELTDHIYVFFFFTCILSLYCGKHHAVHMTMAPCCGYEFFGDVPGLPTAKLPHHRTHNPE